MRKLALIVLLLIGCAPVDTYKVVAITDGDTIRILKDNKEVKIRLAGVDCPERKQDFYTQAKSFTAEKAFGKNVKINVIQESDRYGRVVAEVILPDGTILNEELVKAGFAWHYKQFSKSKVLENLEKEARENKLGLWSNANAKPPWEFRKDK